MTSVAKKTNRTFNTSVQVAFQAFSELSLDGLLIIDREGVIQASNSIISDLFGYSEQELLGESVNVLLPENVRKYHDNILANYFEAPYQRRLGDQFKGRRRDGSLFSMSIGLGHFTHADEPYAIANLSDLSDKIRVQTVVKNQSEPLHQLIEGRALTDILTTITLGIEELQPDWKVSILLSDEQDRKLFIGAAPSLPDCYSKLVDGHPIGVGNASCGTAASTRQPVIVEDVHTHPYWENYREVATQMNIRSCWSRPILDAEDNLLGTFGIYQETVSSPSSEDLSILDDATSLCALAIERSKYENRLKRLANFDSVTGLPNRYMLETYLAEIINADDERVEQIALLFIDLSKFKRVNDKLGHVAGDQLLRDVAQRFRKHQSDTTFLARWGGDEFVVVCKTASVQEVAELARKFADSLRQPFTINQSQYYLGMSTGIAMYPSDSRDAEGLLRCADTAMYEAKRSGVNLYRFFQRSMSDGVARFVSIENQLRSSLTSGSKDMWLELQPQYSMDGKRVSGIEALIRWDSPELAEELKQTSSTLISPAEFIPVAEQTGIINDLGYWIVEQAVKIYAELLKQSGRSIPISVNFSAIQLHDVTLVSRISSLCASYNVPASALKIEVTETAVFSDEKNALDVLMQLKRLGHRISLDDFGTGFASLGYVQKLRPDEIKIDRMFVQGLPDQEDSRNIIIFTAHLAETMGTSLVAEGVETIDQLEVLSDIGEMAIQGYIYGKPMRLGQLKSVISENSAL